MEINAVTTEQAHQYLSDNRPWVRRGVGDNAQFWQLAYRDEGRRGWSDEACLVQGVVDSLDVPDTASVHVVYASSGAGVYFVGAWVTDTTHELHPEADAALNGVPDGASWTHQAVITTKLGDWSEFWADDENRGAGHDLDVQEAEDAMAARENEVWLGPEDGFRDHDADLPEEVLAAEAEAEMRAEHAMSWVCGGGRPEDASTAYGLGLAADHLTID